MEHLCLVRKRPCSCPALHQLMMSERFSGISGDPCSAGVAVGSVRCVPVCPLLHARCVLLRLPLEQHSEYLLRVVNSTTAAAAGACVFRLLARPIYFTLSVLCLQMPRHPPGTNWDSASESVDLHMFGR
jgi:hypothetical protein